MEIFVDADACPVKAMVVKLAQERQIPVTMVADYAHRIHDGYSKVVSVDKAADSADFKLLSLLSKGDIVVTQDYGLASMVLGKGAKAVHHNGFEYTHENIEKLLMDRHIGKVVRKAGGRTKGPKKRSAKDNEQFALFMAGFLDQCLKDNKEIRK